MHKVTVMFDIDARLLAILQQDADRRGVSVADLVRNAVSQNLRLEPAVIQKVSAAQS